MVDLNTLRVYQRALRLGDLVWEAVLHWDWFARKTMGDQIVRSVDSIAANISEGNGRYYYGDNRRFCYYARGSLQETRTWVEKAAVRGLLSEETHATLQSELQTTERMLNAYIYSIGRTNAQSREDGSSSR